MCSSWRQRREEGTGPVQTTGTPLRVSVSVNRLNLQGKGVLESETLLWVSGLAPCEACPLLPAATGGSVLLTEEQWAPDPVGNTCYSKYLGKFKKFSNGKIF